MWGADKQEDVGHTHVEKKTSSLLSHMMSSELEALRLAYHMWCAFLQLFVFYLLCLCATVSIISFRSSTFGSRRHNNKRGRISFLTFWSFKVNFIHFPLYTSFCPRLLEVSTSLAHHRTSDGRRCAMMTNLFAQCLKTTQKAIYFYKIARQRAILLSTWR